MGSAKWTCPTITYPYGLYPKVAAEASKAKN
jgi:hypothetical protein